MTPIGGQNRLGEIRSLYLGVNNFGKMYFTQDLNRDSGPYAVNNTAHRPKNHNETQINNY